MRRGYIEAQSAVCDFLRDFGKPATPSIVSAWTKIDTDAARSALAKLAKKGCVSSEMGPNPLAGRSVVLWYSYVRHPEPSKATDESREYFREYRRRQRAKAREQQNS